VIDAPLALAFTAGLVATVNPCGFVMLPAYLSWFIGTADDEARPHVASRLARALAVSAVVSATFLVVFTAVGLLFSAGALVVVEVIPWLALVVGAGVVVLGVAMFRGWKPAIALPQLSGGVRGRGAGGAVVFGVSYAIASLSCTLPVFLAVVAGTVTRTNLASGVATFVAYGTGMSLVLVAVAVAVAVARTALVKRLRLASRRMDGPGGGGAAGGRRPLRGRLLGIHPCRSPRFVRPVRLVAGGRGTGAGSGAGVLVVRRRGSVGRAPDRRGAGGDNRGGDDGRRIRTAGGHAASTQAPIAATNRPVPAGPASSARSAAGLPGRKTRSP